MLHLISRDSPRTGRRAFTLVELLVVIGIIALLLSILLPALAKAKEQANRAKCSSNLYQLGMCLRMYANSFAGTLPRTAQHTDWWYWNQWTGCPGFPGWDTGMRREALTYLMDSCGATPKIFLCPSADPKGSAAYMTGLTLTYTGGRDPDLTFPTNYVYYGQCDSWYPASGNWAGDGSTGRNPWGFAPWAVVKQGKGAPYSIEEGSPPARTWNGDLAVFTRPSDPSRFATEAQLRRTDFANPPVASDITMKADWGDWFNHGYDIEHALSYSVYMDGHVEAHNVSATNDWFNHSKGFSGNDWGHIWHMR